jgi:cell division protein FtsQ
VRRVLLEGDFQRVSPPEVEGALAKVAQGGLASVDLGRIRDRVEAMDWVDRAVVTRVWPDAIRVVVVEQVAAAQWNDAGLLNARGELFLRNARYVPPELPLLEGPEGSESQVAQLYIDAQGRLLESGLRLTGVRLDDRGAWELELAGGLQVRLGRQDVKERLERFIRLASPMVAKRAAEISYVDMRYTNGFSVGWNGGRDTRCLESPKETCLSASTSAPRKWWRSSASSPWTARSRWWASARTPRAD